MKLKAIETVTALVLGPGDAMLADGLEIFMALCLDESADVRALMRKKFVPRFVDNADSTPVASALRARLVRLVLSRLINGCSFEDKTIALQVVGSIGRSEPVLVETLLTMLEGDSPETRTLVLQCLHALRCADLAAITQVSCLPILRIMMLV